MNRLVTRVLLLEEGEKNIEEKINILQQSTPKRFETLVGVCARLSFIDEIRVSPFTGNIRSETENYLYQTNRLFSYLTTTCIDVLTGEHYQSYYQWLKKSYENDLLGDDWNQALNELSQHLPSDKTANLFVKWTKVLHEQGYKKTSIGKAFKNFVDEGKVGLKDWFLQNYIVEELTSNFEPKKSWQFLTDKDKCENIARYLYALRNLYTHTVIPYLPMESVQHSNSNLPEKYRVKGFVSIFFPPTKKDEPYRRISLPEDKIESDVIRLLVITWIRTHWLQMEINDEDFIKKYWKSRIAQ